MISKFGFGLLTSWSEWRCICCRSLLTTASCITYTMAKMHIFLSEVDLSRLASRPRVLKSVSRLTTI